MFGTPLIHPEGKTVTKQEEGNDAQSDKAGDALLLALISSFSFHVAVPFSSEAWGRRCV
jgi:hypothetical protein